MLLMCHLLVDCATEQIIPLLVSIINAGSLPTWPPHFPESSLTLSHFLLTECLSPLPLEILVNIAPLKKRTSAVSSLIIVIPIKKIYSMQLTRRKKLRTAVPVKLNKLKNIEAVVNVKKKLKIGNLIKMTKMKTWMRRISSAMKAIPWYRQPLHLLCQSWHLVKFTSHEVPSKPNNVKLTSCKGKIPPAPVALNPIVNGMGCTLNQVNFVLHSTYHSLTFSYLRQFG